MNFPHPVRLVAAAICCALALCKTAHAALLLIMPVGDSITAGYTKIPLGGCRSSLAIAADSIIG